MKNTKRNPLKIGLPLVVSFVVVVVFGGVVENVTGAVVKKDGVCSVVVNVNKTESVERVVLSYSNQSISESVAQVRETNYLNVKNEVVCEVSICQDVVLTTVVRNVALPVCCVVSESVRVPNELVVV